MRQVVSGNREDSEIRLHHWEYNLALLVHRCEESHPFLHHESENPCNGCGVVVEDRELVKYCELGLPRLVLDLIAAGIYPR